MLFNRNLNKIKQPIDCMSCEFFDKTQKKCNGLGRVCFEFDPKTQTCIDPITKLPINLKGEK